MNRDELAVGQPVIVMENGRQRAATVTKIGRTLVHITVNGFSHPTPYRIDTQEFNGAQYGYGQYFRTTEQQAEAERVTAAFKALRDAKVTLESGHGFTPAQIETLAALAASFKETTDG